ncbi:MAG: ABC transporter ATP-binding protein [Clostridia bacterium]|nr:ABC transporter ATP-binding protein [Clostridia bacterium]
MTNEVFKETKVILKRYKKSFLKKLVISVILRAFLLIIPVLFSAVVNHATKGEFSAAYFCVGLTIVMAVSYRLSERINRKLYYDLYSELNQHYTSRGLNKTNRNSTYSLSRFNVGQYTNLLTADVDIISAFFGNLPIRMVHMAEFIIIFGYFLSLDVMIFVSAVLVFLFVLALLPLSNRIIEKLNSKRKSELDKVTLSIHDFFQDIKDIKCLDLFEKVSPSVKNRNASYLVDNANYNVKYYQHHQMFTLIFEVARLLTVGYAIYLIPFGKIEIGSLIIIYNYYQKIIDNFSTILTITLEYTNLKVSLGRFNHLIEFSHPRNTLSSDVEYITEGKIKFENILYGYKNDPTLRDVSFEIKPNSLNIITGKAGTGIGGILDLILKLNQQHYGEIFIDDTNINDIPNDEYFSKVSLLREDSHLFNMSIKDNLKLITDNEEEIIEICQKLNIHNEIIRLKQGYETIVSERDEIPVSLKRLILIARTILKSSKIMLFDKALLGLNNEEQDIVMNYLLELKQNHTIVIVSHDRNVMKNAENIIVVDGKEVAESGTLKELIANKGKYYEMYEKPSKQ